MFNTQSDVKLFTRGHPQWAQHHQKEATKDHRTPDKTMLNGRLSWTQNKGPLVLNGRVSPKQSGCLSSWESSLFIWSKHFVFIYSCRPMLWQCFGKPRLGKRDINLNIRRAAHVKQPEVKHLNLKLTAWVKMFFFLPLSPYTVSITISIIEDHFQILSYPLFVI